MIELAGNLIVEDGKILLLYRKDEQHRESQRSPDGESCSTSIPEGCWGVPGGEVEGDESATEAAVRVSEEDIGVSVELRKPFYSGEFQHDDDMFLWHGYVAEIVEGRPEVQESRFEKLEWFDPRELDDIELAPSIKMILPALRKLNIDAGR